ncbi:MULTISPECIES: DUF4236 domain-containing protein [Cytobacillus]|uniref:DUF4236 domain-containing protein n=1 Tax=Cytobacillus TaxID=2675230 RepID=UPI00203F06BC|nr:MULTISPECIES: DUF4236 domain-containing protein [Cytobacillus]MCM3394883.1 DUF4236 domain-containing protein [Cytobacillus oceanisediminis]UQX56038.1 DUF4236 domain-containing protein [Cytobacillus pseudoceanisediminis]
MGLGFRKSFKIAPGVRVNVSHRSVGVSAGVKGLRHSVNSRGQSRTTASIPGTGISYTSTSSSKRKYKSTAHNNRQQLIRQQKELAKLEELQRAQHEVELFENKIDLIKSIHKECDDTFDWYEISQSRHPYHTNSQGKNELEAMNKLANFKPSFMQKMLKTADKEEQKLRDEIIQAIEQDKLEFEELKRTISIANKVLQQDVDIYFQVIDELSPLDDLLEFGSGFEFFIEDPRILEVDFNVHSKNIIPTQQKSLTKTGKLSVKDMPKSTYFDIYQDYVCSCAIRIARDMFAILPFDQVVVNAMDELLDTSTGRVNSVPILSVKFDKEKLNYLNFETIDCSDSMSNFIHNMNFKKTQGFKPVEKVQINN